MKFQKATKKQSRARVALMGPGGSGKTWSALEIGTGIGERIAVIDSERGSASKYSDKFNFDVVELESFSPEKYIEAIQAAESAGYDVLVIDSLSHAWNGKDGVLERVDQKGGFTGGGWKEATPLQNRMVDAILNCKAHVIVTLRQKTEYALEKNEKGKMVPKKLGLAPVQREGLEYEFDVVAALDVDNNLSVEKTRCATLHGKVWKRQNPEIAKLLKEWLTDGAPIIPSQPGRVESAATATATQASPVVEGVSTRGSTGTIPAVDAAKKVFPGAKVVDSGPKVPADDASGGNGDRVKPLGAASGIGEAADRVRRLGKMFSMPPPDGLAMRRPEIVDFLVSHYGTNQLSALTPEQVASCEQAVIAMLADGAVAEPA